MFFRKKKRKPERKDLGQRKRKTCENLFYKPEIYYVNVQREKSPSLTDEELAQTREKPVSSNKKEVICLVDSENPGSKAVKDISNKEKERAEFYFFYSENSFSYTGELVKEVIEEAGNKQTSHLIHCHTGQNAVDFQIISYIGLMIRDYPKKTYIICSNDRGYAPAINVYRDFGIKICQCGYNASCKKAVDLDIAESLDLIKKPHLENNDLSTVEMEKKQEAAAPKTGSEKTQSGKTEPKQPTLSVFKVEAEKPEEKMKKQEEDTKRAALVKQKRELLEQYLGGWSKADKDLIADITVTAIKDPGGSAANFNSLLVKEIGGTKAAQFYKKVSKADRKKLLA